MTWILRSVPPPRTDIGTHTIFIFSFHSPEAVVCPIVMDEDIGRHHPYMCRLPWAVSGRGVFCITSRDWFRLRCALPPLRPISAAPSALHPTLSVSRFVCSFPALPVCSSPGPASCSRPPASLGHVLCPALQQKQPQKPADRRAISAAQPADLAFDSCSPSRSSPASEDSSPSPVWHHS